MVRKVKIMVAAVTFMVIGLVIFTSSAFATNGHQDHQGACARSTSSIKKGVTDLRFNGVLGTAANRMGIRGLNGSISKQMEEQLVIGKVKYATTTANTGCDGNGGTFGADTRELRKGEEVAVRVPAKIGNSACKHPNPRCKRVVIVVNDALPVSCWNLNSGRVVVVIWVHKKRQHHGRKPVLIRKVTKDSSGNKIPTPTGTFRFWVNTSRWKHGKKVVLKHNPQRIGRLPRGTKVVVKEIRSIGPNDWKVVSARVQRARVRGHRLKFVFVNKERGHPVPAPPSCEAQGLVTVAGNCVNQSQDAKQECEAENSQWNGNQCQITQVQIVCGNAVVGNEGGTVEQGGNCNTIVVEEPCECTPPPPPPPPPAPEPPIVEWERIQEVFTDHTRNLCVTVTPATGVSVQFGVKWGERSNGGKGVYNAGTNKYCVTYTAPSEEPPHVCEEAISSELPSGTKCDIAYVAVTSSNGAKTVKGQMEIPILEEDNVVVW